MKTIYFIGNRVVRENQFNWYAFGVAMGLVTMGVALIAVPYMR